jgi:hypothetical protein
MKLIWNYLIPAYFDALDGNIIINGEALPVFDGEAPATTTGSYILLGDRTSTQVQAKGAFQSEVTLLVDVVIKGDIFGFKDSEDAAEQIMQLINSDENPQCSSSFQVVTTSIQSTNNLNGLNRTDNIFRTLIRYAHKVNQI